MNKDDRPRVGSRNVADMNRPHVAGIDHQPGAKQLGTFHRRLYQGSPRQLDGTRDDERNAGRYAESETAP